MMMECPRCGLEQPKDRYCASCGLDVDKFLAKPKPLFIRLVSNPNLHLSLIAILIVIVIGYIFYMQRGVKSRVDAFFAGTPLSSREAGDPNAPARERRGAGPAKLVEEKVEEQAPAEESAAAVTETPAASADAKSATVPEPQKMEFGHWEIPRDILAGLLSGAEKLGESNGGRAYYWSQGTKTIEAIEKNGRRITLPRTLGIENGAQVQVETPPTAPEAFQFGLYFQLSKADGKDPNVKWESTMVLPPQEAATEATARQPVVKSLTETTLSGTSPIAAQGALLIVFEPSNRAPRMEYINRAGEGPWTVLASDAFRAGASDWVILIQLK